MPHKSLIICGTISKSVSCFNNSNFVDNQYFFKKLDAVDVSAEILDWNEETEESLKRLLPIDTVFAADVVYDPDLAKILAEFLKKLLNISPDLEIFIASTIRNPTTYKVFIDKIHEFSMKVEDLSSSVKVHTLFQYPSDNIQLLKLSKK
jgi:hypothetical protein